jgi:hypothetical protein
MKPTVLMWQMKALLPTDSKPCTTFISMFLLHLPSEMRDHLTAKDFKDCTLMAEYADLLHSSRASCAVAAVNTDYEAAISAVSSHCRCQEFSPHYQCHRSPSCQGPGRRKHPAGTRTRRLFLPQHLWR